MANDGIPLLAELAEAHPPGPRPESDAEPFIALARAIVHQQISLAAGRTVYARLDEAVGGVTPQNILVAGEQALRGAGLSGQKTGYLLDLAGHVQDGRLVLDGFDDASDDEVVQELVTVKGIGTWSAKMFLMFHMARPDVCPWEDLGIRLAVARFYGIDEKAAATWLREEGAPMWAPYNSLAARVLWHARRD